MQFDSDSAVDVRARMIYNRANYFQMKNTFD